jgi:hypothetical protein
MTLTILRNTRTRASLHVDLVALNDQDRAGVVGEDPRGQQAGNTANQHARRVEQQRRALGKIDPSQFVEHGNRRFCHGPRTSL